MNTKVQKLVVLFTMMALASCQKSNFASLNSSRSFFTENNILNIENKGLNKAIAEPEKMEALIESRPQDFSNVNINSETKIEAQTNKLTTKISLKKASLKQKMVMKILQKQYFSPKKAKVFPRISEVLEQKPFTLVLWGVLVDVAGLVISYLPALGVLSIVFYIVGAALILYGIYKYIMNM